MGLKVVIASPEIIPFAKTGGLADVAGSLPLALKRLDCEVALFMPLYREVATKWQCEPTGLSVNVPMGSRIIPCEIFKHSIAGIPIYFLKRDEYFDRSFLYSTPDGDYFDNLERFTFFSRGVVEAVHALGIKPDIIHCNDWQTGLIPAYLKSVYASRFTKTSTVFTIHNIAYQGVFPAESFPTTGLPSEFYGVEGMEYWGSINLLKSGIVFSDAVTTVSEGYSREIQTPEFGYGMEGVLGKRKASLFGVLNGVDYGVWNSETDKFIAANFSPNDLKGKAVCKLDLIKEYGLKADPMMGPDPALPLIGIISRLADQKGFDLISGAIDELMAMPLSMVVLGTGEKKYHTLFEDLAKRFPGKLGVRIAFDNALSHKIEAGCDMFLMPSRYEPCGLNQFYSLRYGTIPIVRATGGLDDTIADYGGGKGNGFKFTEYSKKALIEKIKEAIEVYGKKKSWQALQKKAMKEDFSWDRSAKKYVSIYEFALKARKA